MIPSDGTPAIPGWKTNLQIPLLAELYVGQVLLVRSDAPRHQALCVVTETQPGVAPGLRQHVLAVFIDPTDANLKRLPTDTEFPITTADLACAATTFFKVERSYDLALTGSEVVGLMRKHKVKIREIKQRSNITLKRIRHVREHGVSGFDAECWVQMITGSWPRLTTSIRS